MSGVTDLPFRRLVKRLGAGSRRLRDDRQPGDDPRDPAVDDDGEKLRRGAADGGAARRLRAARSWPRRQSSTPTAAPRIIDINFGCPVKKVVNGHAGSALMRDELHAARILEATVNAVDLPVTLKMRTGWDETQPQRAAARPDRRSLRHSHDHRARPHPLPALRRLGRLGVHPPGQGSGDDPGHRQWRHRHPRRRRAGARRNRAPTA